VPEPGKPDTIPLAEQVEQALIRDLWRLDDLRTRYEIAVATPPAEGSAAEKDLAEKERAYAHDLAAIALWDALDHLLAWQNLLKGGLVPVYAHMSLIRTAYESALLSYWLLEPGLVPDVRRARGVAAQIADYEERRKFEEAAGFKVPPPGKMAAQRLADLRAVSRQLGLTRQNRKGETILAVSVPATVELFDMYEAATPNAKGQWRYRLYSGYAHGKQWATTIGAQLQAPYDSVGRSIVMVQSVDDLTVDATRRCVNAVDRSLGAYEQLRK
jgi:hypothetical protein